MRIEKQDIVTIRFPKHVLCNYYMYPLKVWLSIHTHDPWIVGDPFASFSVHLASSAVTPTGSVHKSRSDIVVRMYVQLKRRWVSFSEGGIVVMDVI